MLRFIKEVDEEGWQEAKAMTAKERTLWEQAVQVLRHNSVTTTVAVETPRAEQVLTRARERAVMRGEAHFEGSHQRGYWD
jgi:hypothetical protein